MRRGVIQATSCLFLLVSTLTWARGNSRPSFEFDPHELEAIRGSATQEVLAKLNSMTTEELDIAAAQKFPERDRKFDGRSLGMTVTDLAIIAEELDDKRKAFRTETVLEAVHAAYKARYGNLIIDKPIWAWNNVGNTYARIAILACSFKEYIALWGTALPQEGFSGVYKSMDVFDIMVTGKMKSGNASSNAANAEVYIPGGRVSHLQRGETRFYTLNEYTYMIDYGRGKIASSMWQGIFAPYLFSNHDWESLSTQFTECMKKIL